MRPVEAVVRRGIDVHRQVVLLGRLDLWQVLGADLSLSFQVFQAAFPQIRHGLSTSFLWVSKGVSECRIRVWKV